MATMPDWKLQLLARRRQEEAAVRGREKAERDRLSQMPAWKRGLLERRRAKLGVSPGEPSPAPGSTEPGPPDPDESAVLLEAIGPVHQNRFIRQERQQRLRTEELAERRPAPLEARERPSPGDTREQSPKGRDCGAERPAARDATERDTGGASEPEPRDWRQNRGEPGEPSSRLAEAYKWRPSSAEPPERILRAAEPLEQSPRRKEGRESRLSSPESDGQHLGLPEAHTWRPDFGEAQEPSLVQLEASGWSRTLGQASKDCLEECRSEGEQAARVAPEGCAGPPETLLLERPDHSPGQVEDVEPRPSPVEDGDEGWRPTERRKWTLNAGNVREWTPRDIETPIQKPEPAEKHVGPGREAEEPGAGAQGRPRSTPQNHSCVSAPCPAEDAGTRGPRLQEEEAEVRPPLSTPLSPSPRAPPAPLPPGDPLMSRLFYGVKPGPGVGAPRRSGHTFTVNPRRSVPAAAVSSPPSPASADAAAPGAGKKRYPTAEEILVLGGYLRLSRSCLVKGSPERHHKQLKISFSETALETTYQYPSESSVLEELGPEPEAPSPPAAQPDDDEDEEELLLLQRELQGGLRTKALIVDESCRR